MFKTFREGYYNYLAQSMPEEIEEALKFDRLAAIDMYVASAVLSNPDGRASSDTKNI